MEEIAAALGDAARWRIVELLAERPRSVGELADLTGLRQPQATKHLQTLTRAGLVTVSPLGQRRIAAIEVAALNAFERRLRELIELAESTAGELDTIARYRSALAAEAARADRDRWADGRTFTFERVLAAAPQTVWRYWAEPELLESWWAPPSITITDCRIEARPGGRVILDYRDAEGRYHSAGQVRVAEEPGRLGFDLSLFDPAGAVLFTGRYDLTLTEALEGTRLRLDLGITDTAITASDFIAGINTGWGQVLDQLAHLVAIPTKSPRTPRK
ncbi:metalloregulator ArsR/SmtB family transcription factor [Nocardia sp. NPDC059240]|uniref:metalloregulator ArsR/SmtB family transcription factor n=1 Tax=Nocardia sp. NPDC059240 TaxID=3346786 RepID=UPI0036A14019